MTAAASPVTRSLPWFVAWAPAAVYMAIIWAVSSLSLPPSLPDEFPFRDKGIHFVEYGVLGLLVAFATRRTWPRTGLVRTQLFALIVCTGWGLLDELHQAFVPGRWADMRDGLADFLGASAGILIEMACVYFYRRGSRT
jgi:VanZ family protein